MDAALAAVLAALIGAVAGVSGSLINVSRQAQLERQKWLRTLADERANELRSSVKELTTKIAEGFHLATSLCWYAQHDSKHLKQLQIDDYKSKMDALWPQITGLRAVVAGMDRNVHDELSKLVDRMLLQDAQVVSARVKFQEGNPETAKELGSLHIGASRLEAALPRIVADTLQPYTTVPTTSDSQQN